MHASGRSFFQENMGESSITRMKRNVVLITTDCLRADHLSCYGYARKTSPFIDFLSAKGMKFENAFANGPVTMDSFLSILASAYPLEFENQLPLPPNAILISEVLREKGIRTAAIHSNPFLSAYYGYDRGWHYFHDFLARDIARFARRRRLIGNYLPKMFLELYAFFRTFFGFMKGYEDADTVTKCAISWLNRNKHHTFFLWIHYMDLHEPYLVSNAKFNLKYSKNISRLSQTTLNLTYQTLFGGIEDRRQKNMGSKSIRGMIDMYDDKLSYVDKNIKELFHFLDREGLTDHTLLVLTSDHGQEFLDHGRFGHRARFYDELLHIPLILFGPRIKSQVNRSLVSHLDIAPTILEFYGITAPKDYRGHNLLSSSTNSFIISEAYSRSKFRIHAIRTEKWKYIHGEKQREFYDIEKDPKETKNVIDEEGVNAKELAAIIEEHISWEEKMQRRKPIIHEKELISRKIKKQEEEKILERLKELGYL